jgi:hypothetical protein
MKKSFCSLLIFILFVCLNTNFAQSIYIVDVNVSSSPYTVRIAAAIPHIDWHDLKIEYQTELNNSIEIRCQFEGSSVSNALTIFDTTVVLEIDNPYFDMCVYIDWFEETTVSIDTILIDSLCLTSSQILNVQNFGHSTNQPKIFPNPATDNFFIVFDENADVSPNREARVYDLAGNLQFTRSFNDNAYVLEINTENMTQGMYIVVISANGVDVGTYKVAVR